MPTDPNMDYFIHGPCISILGMSSDQDIAISLECLVWPRQANKWVKRPRLWPSQKLVNEIVQNGCHLVAVVPSKNVKEDRLWRLSLNNAVKKLVMAFNNTKLLCYGLLKVVLKECI